MLLITGAVDEFCAREDVQKLKDVLPEDQQWIELDDYTHVDVIWSEFGYRDHHPAIIKFLE